MISRSAQLESQDFIVEVHTGILKEYTSEPFQLLGACGLQTADGYFRCGLTKLISTTSIGWMN